MKKILIVISVVFLFMVGVKGVYADDVTTTKDEEPQVEKLNCEDYKDITSTVWLIIRIAAPALLIVFGAMDMGKAVMAGEEKEMKKATDTLVKRIVICVALFILPTFVDFIVGMLEYGSVTACLY